jgi:hypothetical protein
MRLTRVSLARPLLARPLAALGVIVLAGCIPPANDTPPAPGPEPVATAEPEPVAPPPPPPPVAPSFAGHWMDAPQTAGDWHWRSAGGESFAEFRSAAGNVLVQFNCTSDGEMVLAVANRSPAASGFQVRTETREALLPTGDREGWLEARMAASDTLLDAIAFSRGRFALEVQGSDALYLPSYPEITRVVEDCRG